MKRHSAPLVIGGGPAGSMFALTLARAGRDVTLLEKSKEPHDKVCGEFLSREALVHLQRVGLDVRARGAVPIQHMRLVTPWFQQQSRLPFGASSLTRKTLDEALLSLAIEQGVHVVRGAQVTSLQRDGDTWSAQLRDGRDFAADQVVLATGKLDLGGWPRPERRQPHLLAFKMYYRLADDQQAAMGDAVELVLYPGGYGGLQPVQHGVTNLCFLVDARQLKEANSRVDAAFQHVLQHSAHLRKRLKGSTSLLPKPLAVSRIPYGHLQRATIDSLWRVGDQAAVIPSFCGDGTAIALHSGALAAVAMLQGESAASYQRRLHGQLATRMSLATQVSQLLLRVPRASQITRVFPGLIRTLASLTRIPDSALREVARAVNP